MTYRQAKEILEAKRRDKAIKMSVAKAMDDPDAFVVEFDYEDRHANITTRKASPIRFTQNNRAMLALCLRDDVSKTFIFSRMSCVRLIQSHKVLMPEKIQEHGKAFYEKEVDDGRSKERRSQESE